MAELTATLSPEELVEWQAFYLTEPFGTPVDDQRFHALYQIQWAAGNFKGDMPAFLDRNPEETERQRRRIERAKSVDEQIADFFSQFG